MFNDQNLIDSSIFNSPIDPLPGPSPRTDKSTIEPLLITVAHAQKLLGVGKTKLHAMLTSGALERRKVGRSTRVTMRSVRSIAGV